jgi:lipopolysaccharide transport system ATP-binding protein
MTQFAVEVSNVSKTYKVYDRPYLRILEALARHRKSYHFPSAALKNVSLKIPCGQVFGIVGRNGSGKSTLLQIIASVLQPTSGSVVVNGRVSALLELGSGFNPDFTGIENVYLYGSILGMPKEEITRKLPEIVGFAKIGEYINLPLKTYSSGMIVRLAFATAVAVEPEILIVDEALAVGDAAFQHECILKMRKIINSGATVLFVSHDLSAVKMLCQRAVLLEKGEVVIEGDAETVAKEYHRRLFQEEIQQGGVAKGSDFAFSSSIPRRLNHGSESSSRGAVNYPMPAAIKTFDERTKHNQFGSGEASLIYCELLDQQEEPTSCVEYREKCTIRIFVRFHRAVRSAVVGFVLRNSKGVDIITSNTHIEGSNLTDLTPGDVRAVDFSFRNTLKDDHYSVNPAVCDEEYFHQARPFHWIDNALVFRAGKPRDTIVYSVFYPESMTIGRHVVESGLDTDSSNIELVG